MQEQSLGAPEFETQAFRPQFLPSWSEIIRMSQRGNLAKSQSIKQCTEL